MGKRRVKFLAVISVKQVGVGSITLKRAAAEGPLTTEEKVALDGAWSALNRLIRCKRPPVPQPPEKA